MKWELPDVQAGFRNDRGTQDQIANIHWITEKERELQKKTSISAVLTMSKPLTVWIKTNCGKFLEMGISDHLTYLLRNLYACQEATIRIRHETMDWFQIGKGVWQACILSPYLTDMLSISCEIPGWMKHKLELRLLGEISITSDIQMTPHLWLKVKRNWRASWWKWKRRVKKLT